MPRHDVVKPNAAKKAALHGQNLVHANTAISHVTEAMRHERDTMNQAHLRRALEELRQVKEPKPNDTKARALRRV
jgi:ribosomal protein L5